MRELREVPVAPGSAGVHAVRDALRRALDGGPALAPVPTGDDPYVERVRAALRPDDPGVPLEDDAVVAVVPTSGSTAQPKGVLLTDTAVRAATTALAARIGGEGAWVVALPVHAVGGLMVLVRAALGGARCHVDPSTGGAAPFDPVVFAATTAAARAAEDGPLLVSLVPTQLARIEAAGRSGILRAYDAVLSGAAATPGPLLDRLRDAGVRVLASYGMSETCGGCAYDGIPQPGLTFSTDAPDGRSAGRLSVSGAAVAAGYRLRPGDPALRDGTVRTQDVGVLDPDGRVQVLGRVDDVVQVGGTGVALGAVEAVLAEALGPAGAVCVLGTPDPDRGTRVTAYLAGDAPSDDALAAAVRARLGRAAVPRRFVRLAALPMLVTGKVDRSALRALAGEGR